jgi:hypothetical protein
VEYDTPRNLLEDEGGYFYTLVNNLGDDAAAAIREKAGLL